MWVIEVFKAFNANCYDVCEDLSSSLMYAICMLFNL